MPVYEAEPTPDSPQERDDKAEVLASELRKFRWEVRFYILALLIFGLSNL